MPTSSAAPTVSEPPVITSDDCQVEFVLWNADTNDVVGRLQDQLDANGYFCLPAYGYNFEARPIGGAACISAVESAYLTLDGPRGSGTEGTCQNSMPYTLFGKNPNTGDIYDAGDDAGSQLMAGVSYVLGADFFPQPNLEGPLVRFGDLEFLTQACSDGGTDGTNSPTAEGATDECAVEYLLLDADRTVVVGMLQETECARSNEFSIQAVANDYCPTVESASIQLEGPIGAIRTENIEPFTIFGNDSSEEIIFGRAYEEGSYTIRTKLYSENYLGGALVVDDVFSFAVSGRCEETNQQSKCSVEYILWDADRDVAIGPLQESVCLDSNAEFSIEAKPSSDCAPDGSARLRLEGPIDFHRTENVLPYTIFGDKNGNVSGREYRAGSYTISTKLYPENSLEGELEYEGSFSFTVNNCP